MQLTYSVGTIDVYYRIENDDSITITGSHGMDTRLKLPDDIDGKKIVRINKKSFLGINSLKDVSLPGSIEVIEDWAFAHCTHLENLVIRAGVDSSKLTFEKGVFEGCTDLNTICLGYEEPDDMSYLLGAAVWRLPAAYLLKDPEIGRDSWYVSFDKSLVTYLSQRDDEGYTNRVLCGEEDISYDGIASVDGELLSDGINYVRETVKRKCQLCFLRLYASKNLPEDYKQIFVDYLLERGKGSQYEEAWQVLKDEYADKIEYLKLYANIGGIQPELVDAMLTDLGQQHAEAKAFLIKYKQDNSQSEDFFDGLML